MGSSSPWHLTERACLEPCHYVGMVLVSDIGAPTPPRIVIIFSLNVECLVPLVVGHAQM